MPQLRAKCLRLYRRISPTDQSKHLNNTGKKYGQKVQKKRNPHPASPQERREASGADYPFAGMQDDISCHRMKKGCSQPVSRVLYCTWSAASVIYLRWTSPPTSIVLPSGACRPRHSDGPPSDAGIRGLSSSEVHSTTVTSRLVSSCLTFSPLPP